MVIIAMSKQIDGGGRSIERRSMLKLVSSAGVGLTFGGVASADSDPTVESNAVEVPYPDTTVIKYDNSLYQITSHSHLLALSDEAIDRHFSASSLEGREFESTRGYVESLRARYPVEIVQDGNEKRFQLSDQAQKNLNSERRSGKPLLESGADSQDRPAPSEGGIPAVQTARDYMALKSAISVFGSDPPNHSDISPQWEPNHHPDLLDDTKDDVDSSAEFYEWASDPDEFSEWANDNVEPSVDVIDVIQNPGIMGPAWIIDKVRVLLTETANNIWHNNYAQYYDPNAITISVPGVDDIKLGGIGAAPGTFAHFYWKAKDASYDYYTRKYTAWASHYLHDMAQPLHTGMGIEQAGITWDIDVNVSLDDFLEFDISYNTMHWLHYGYEQLVRNMYEDEFQQHFKGWSTNSVYTPEETAREMAQTSSEYSADVFHTILDNETAGDDTPSSWSDTTKQTVTEDLSNCFAICGSHCREIMLNQGFGEEPDNPYCPPLCE